MKAINYSINLAFTDLDFMKDLKGQQFHATLHLFCMITHISKTYGVCSVYQGQLAETLKMHQMYIREAKKHLIKHEMIIEIKAPDKRDLSPGIYKPTEACIKIVKNLYQKRSKPVSQGDRVNYNSIKNYKGKDDAVNTSSLSKKEEPTLPSLPSSNSNKLSWEQE